MPSKKSSKSSKKSKKTSAPVKAAAAPTDQWGDFAKRFTLITGALDLFRLVSALAYMKRHDINWKEYLHRRNPNPDIPDTDVLGWK